MVVVRQRFAGVDRARLTIRNRFSHKSSRRALADQSAEPAFKALLLALPSEMDLAQAVAPVDPAALHEARETLRTRLRFDDADG